MATNILQSSNAFIKHNVICIKLKKLQKGVRFLLNNFIIGIKTNRKSLFSLKLQNCVFSNDLRCDSGKIEIIPPITRCNLEFEI